MINVSPPFDWWRMYFVKVIVKVKCWDFSTKMFSELRKKKKATNKNNWIYMFLFSEVKPGREFLILGLADTLNSS